MAQLSQTDQQASAPSPAVSWLAYLAAVAVCLGLAMLHPKVQRAQARAQAAKAAAPSAVTSSTLSQRR